jgi:hypothetical protein
MGNFKRFMIVKNTHIGFGIWWDTVAPFYTIDITIALPFYSIFVGIGKLKNG